MILILILSDNPYQTLILFFFIYSTVRRVRGGTHGQILLRACTVYISDSEPDKSDSLPESSHTNPLYSLYDSITFNIAKVFSLCSQYSA